ncbi:MAG: hypothetical protein II464_03200 [Oscillospiraceae bacterium]|nr:hypothetical protein [Oscillospiraceae bacterium]
MKKIIVRSVYDAFDYVMEHYYPAGLKEFAERTDTYAVISIQDSHTGGFGIRFCENAFCKDVLTLIFDDIDREVEGAVLFTDEMADSIISFIDKNRGVDTLLVHCYGGQSRSRAVGAFAMRYLGKDDSVFFENGDPNPYVYSKLIDRAGIYKACMPEME